MYVYFLNNMNKLCKIFSCKFVIKKYLLINDKYCIFYIDNEVRLIIFIEFCCYVFVLNKWSEVNKIKKVFVILMFVY